jgi:site-specific DNA-methyltransferase (adenine-specific)
MRLRTNKDYDYSPQSKEVEIWLNCILLTTEEGDLVLDPFLGSGTTAIVSKKLNRRYIGIEIDQKYMDLSKELLETLNNIE